MTEILEQLAKKHRTYISQLRIQPGLRWEALGDLYRFPNKETYPMEEWSEAASYLLGCLVEFSSYQQVENDLRPFSMAVQ